MNGKKKKNKKLVLDSGKIGLYLEVPLASNYSICSLQFKNLIFIILHFFRFKLKWNEYQKEDSFQI
jgi:hypothetical protein